MKERDKMNILLNILVGLVIFLIVGIFEFYKVIVEQDKVIAEQNNITTDSISRALVTNMNALEDTPNSMGEFKFSNKTAEYVYMFVYNDKTQLWDRARKETLQSATCNKLHGYAIYEDE